jgi:hypothetical protein
MAKASGLGDNFCIGGFDLSGDVASLDKISGPVAPLEATTINEFAEDRLFGLRSGTMQFTTYFDNTGTTTAPDLPDTTVPLVSTFPWYVFATISGGTVTEVNVNGVNVGSGDGTYLIPPLGTVILTYTGTPTWVWLGVNAEHNALSTLPRTDTIATYLRGTALGNAAASCLGVQLNYDPTRDNTGNLTLQVEVDADGYGLEWGIQLTPGLRADVADTNGTYIDSGAASSFGAQAYLQLVAIIGTSVDVVVQHSPDHSTWATLIDFGSKTNIGSFREALSNTAAVDRYVRVITTGTFTYAQFAVMFNRNQVAGTRF